jgi:hypothetical protein
MFSEKNIIVTIGDQGAVVALHENNETKAKIFVDELNDAVKTELKDFFAKNELAQVYILLDTIDQSYKKKSYPSVRTSDLARIVKRDMNSDGDKESLKSYFILNPKKSLTLKNAPRHRWECMFVSTSSSPAITQWVEFLIEMPNRLVGIYMLPVETFALFELIKKKVKEHSKAQDRKNNLCCIVMQNKVGGIRQIVYSESGIVFTRIVTYDFDQIDFLEKYEQDIYSTFEYLKRLFPDLQMKELDIVNIFSSKALDIIKTLRNVELNPINQTPFELASEIGYSQSLSQDSNFCDLLISKIFSEKKKKILKFVNPKITFIDRYFIILKLSKYLNIGVAALAGIALISSLLVKTILGGSIKQAETEKVATESSFKKIKEAALDDSKLSAEDRNIDSDIIMDLGKMEEAIGSIGANFTNFYIKLKFVKDFNVKLNEFSYSLTGLNAKAPAKNATYHLNFKGDIANKSGDIDDLFKEFDIFVAEVKKSFQEGGVEYSELPKNIDFNKKYYSFPIDFTVGKN